MCSIVKLASGVSIPYALFENAVHNNPHGYGILLKDGGRIQCIKECPEKGNDPEAIYKILEDNLDIERWVHLRWATVGNVSNANTQPFPLLSTNKRALYFMHNGTIQSYRTSYYRNGVQQEVVEDEDSDTKKHANKLTELISRLTSESGKGDIQDPIIQEILKKFWESHWGRSVIISSDQEPLYFGAWKNLKINGKETEIVVSNDDYFDVVKRGPLFEARRAETERQKKLLEEKEKERTAKEEVTVDSSISPLTCPGFSKRFSISEDVADILEDYDIYNPAGYVLLANMTASECTKLFDKINAPSGAWLFLTLCKYLKEETEKRRGMELKLEEFIKGSKNENRRSMSEESESIEAAA